MCQQHKHRENTDFAGEKKFRLADIFNKCWDKYCEQPTEFIFPEQYKAVNAIRVCRTEVLGVDYYSCPDCGDVSEVRHSCKNRFCPTCSWKDTVRWAEEIKSKMLNIPHRHCVFTLPHRLNKLIKNNKKTMLNILPRISADIFKSWFKSKYDVKIGVISVIHTFGEKKNDHYHVHMIVSWGGIHNKTGELIEFKGKEKEYISYNHLKKEFRRKYVNELEELFDSKELEHNFLNKKEFKKFITKLHLTAWQIHLEEPMDTPAAVIRYIGRYSKRACLSEYKITNIAGEYITFRYKDYKDRIDPDDKKSPAIEKELCLHYSEFFPLLLQHVPKPYFRMVRYYGCYGSFKNIPEEYRAIENEQLLETIEKEYETSENNPKFCTACTCAKVYVNTLLDKRIKSERTEPFDIEKHSHIFYEKATIKIKENNLKKAS